MALSTSEDQNDFGTFAHQNESFIPYQIIEKTSTARDFSSGTGDTNVGRRQFIEVSNRATWGRYQTRQSELNIGREGVHSVNTGL